MLLPVGPVCRSGWSNQSMLQKAQGMEGSGAGHTGKGCLCSIFTASVFAWSCHFFGRHRWMLWNWLTLIPTWEEAAQGHITWSLVLQPCTLSRTHYHRIVLSGNYYLDNDNGTSFWLSLHFPKDNWSSKKNNQITPQKNPTKTHKVWDSHYMANINGTNTCDL